jgi:tRNA pseudouridine38-40 synthase
VLLVSYLGKDFSGSQSQANALSVQHVLNTAMTALNIPFKAFVFAGRTDAGVNAKGQVVHVDVDALAFSRIAHIEQALNAHLPQSVRIRAASILPSTSDFHSIRSARWRWYQYRIYNQPYQDFWCGEDSLWIASALDKNAMAKAAIMLEGSHEFTSFKAAHASTVSDQCHVLQSEVTEDGPWICINLVANRFIYKMVRNIVGTLIQVGQAKRCPNDMLTLLRIKNRQFAGPTAPPKGLSLMAVSYSEPWGFFENDFYVKTLRQRIQEFQLK